MAVIPKVASADSQTVLAIYEGYRKKADSRRQRRIGASQIGTECDRRLWLNFRWAGREEFDGRMLRLFQTGHLEEIRVIDNLRMIGCTVHNRDEVTGEQFEFISVGGHLVDKIDGAVLGVPEGPKTWHVLEVKTASSKRFQEIVTKGVRVAKPDHYAQCCVGMKLSGMTRCLYIIVNKDNDHVYSERLRYEESKADAEALLERAERIVKLKEPPERIADGADKLPCRFCHHAERCHGKAVADVTCRSCVHATPTYDPKSTLGLWRCDKHRKALSEAEQANACADHLFVPALVPYAEAVDSGADPAGDWIEYRNPDGTTWRQGRQKDHYRSLELTVLPPELVGAGIVDEVKVKLGGEVVEVQHV